MIFVGIDWSEEGHSVELQAANGDRLKQLRIGTGIEGLSKLQEAILEQEVAPEQVVVAIETSRGPLVNALVGSGYLVYAVNPLTSARAREGEAPSRSKSDRADARMLANLVRTKRGELRQLAGDSPEAQAVRIRARSHLRALRLQQRQRNQLRSTLLNFYAGGLHLLEKEDLRDALAVLQIAPEPRRGRRVTQEQIIRALAGLGRERNLAAKAATMQAQLREPQLELRSQLVVAAYADEVSFIVRSLLQLRKELAQLEEQLADSFRGHPDAEIYKSLPGLADVLGARVLGESGDDPAHYRNARARKNYAGNSPVTKASGKYRQVSRRVVRNRVLADAGWRWAFSALTASPGARQYYDQLVARGHTHNQALRALANRLTGILHGCLKNRSPYQESLAWTSALRPAA